MLRFDHQPAYILHSRPYQETNLILELFTLEHGRLSAIAKGVRKPKSRTRALLQPFVPLLISCAGRGEMLAVKETENKGPMHFLQGQALISGFYLNELLMRLMHRFDPHPDLFAVYQDTLQRLEVDRLTADKSKVGERGENIGLEKKENEKSDKDENKEPDKIIDSSKDQTTQLISKILRLFEKFLLKTIGYELQLNKEAETGNTIVPENFYLFHPERGPSLLKEHIPSAQLDRAVKLKTAVFKGSSLIAIANDILEDSAVLLDAKRLLRLALKTHLGERPVESRRLF